MADELDEILDKLGKAISANPRGEGPAYAYTQAKQALTEWRDKAVVAELEKLQADIDNYPAYKPIKTARITATELVQNRLQTLSKDRSEDG